MITARTKKQLMIFLLITLLGVSYVGARYAKLTELVYSSDYILNAELPNNGGIFQGAEVTYRGVTIGQVDTMYVTKHGVNVAMKVSKDYRFPRNTIAQIANKSAVGEQYVNLKPQTDKGPYLKEGATIPMRQTELPISTTTILTNLDQLVKSVPRKQLRTAVTSLGTAFAGTGRDLGQIIDTSTSFIQTANRNFSTTSALLRDSETVLATQNDKQSAIRTFARNLALVSGTLAGHDQDLRRLIDNGSATANELRTFLQQNHVQLGQLINNLVTTGEVTVKHLKAERQLLVLYPYVVAGAYTVLQRGAGGYDARFGLTLTSDPAVCTAGYNPKPRRTPYQRSNKPLNTRNDCRGGQNYRGARHAPNGRAAASYRAPVASYDYRTGKVTWADQAKPNPVVYDGGARELFGRQSDQWLLLQPTLGAGR